MDPTIAIPLEDRHQLGEGPVWDERRGELLQVDIPAGRVVAWRPGEAAARTVASFAGDASAVVLRRDGGLVVAVDRELRRQAGEGWEVLARTGPEDPRLRLNDCRCDPSGRLWAGTMAKDRTPGLAGLYRVDPDGRCERVLDATTISNGMGWDAAGERMYFIDSTTQRIDRFDYDAPTGTISGRRELVAVDPDDGLPDGLAVDAEGCLWVCLFGGGALRRYGPDGTLEAHLDLPVSNPTCPTFGGPDLDTLYVTSARHRLDAEQLAREPAAGATLALSVGARGLPAHRFAG